MALLFETVHGDTHYSVRSHGASLRLYSNGVFHSQWNEGQPFNGGVWDCLSLPVFYRPLESIRRILLLGVGGGAVIRQLDSLLDYSAITAVEIDSVHIDIAQQWFGITDKRVHWVKSDAVSWLANHQAEPYDMVIDDLFGHCEGEPQRAAVLSYDWISLLGRHLSTDGILVVNSVDARELKSASGRFADAGFRYGHRWTLRSYENAIGVFSRASLQARFWSRQLEGSDLGRQSQRFARAIVRRPMRGLDQTGEF